MISKILALIGLAIIFYLVCLVMGLGNQDKNLTTFQAGRKELGNAVLVVVVMFVGIGSVLGVLCLIMFLLSMLFGKPL